MEVTPLGYLRILVTDHAGHQHWHSPTSKSILQEQLHPLLHPQTALTVNMVTHAPVDPPMTVMEAVIATGHGQETIQLSGTPQMQSVGASHEDRAACLVCFHL